VLILTLHNRREYVEQARLAGAEGYLLKDEATKELLPAIEALRQGGTYLSPLLREEGSTVPFPDPRPIRKPGVTAFHKA